MGRLVMRMIGEPNRRYVAAAIGGALLVAAIVMILVLRRPPEPVASTTIAAPKPLANGTPIRLILADDLTSGGAKEGSTVRFVLNTDLGRDELPKMGELVTCTVTWSRSEGTLGGLTNRPARLKVKIDSLGPYFLSASRDEAQDYEFNRENTGLPSDRGTDVSAEKVDLLEKLLVGQSNEEISADFIESLGSESSLPETQKLLKSAPYVHQTSVIAALASGGTTAEFSLALSAVNEIRGVLGRNIGKLKRTLSGRNIHAYPGTEVTVYVWKPTP